MVRVHCSKDTLDAHARSDVVLRSRKVVKSITAHIGNRAIRALRKRLRLRSACSAAPACRPRRSDHLHQSAITCILASIRTGNLKLQRTCSQMATRTCSATPTATSWVIAHNHNKEATTFNYPRHPRHITPACPATCSALSCIASCRCNSMVG